MDGFDKSKKKDRARADEKDARAEQILRQDPAKGELVIRPGDLEKKSQEQGRVRPLDVESFGSNSGVKDGAGADQQSTADSAAEKEAVKQITAAIHSLSRSPRDLPLALKIQVLCDGMWVRLGWMGIALAMLILFALWDRVSVSRILCNASESEKTVGQITKVAEALEAPKYSPHQSIIKFRYQVLGKNYLGLATDWVSPLRADEKVEVTYLKSKPAVSYLKVASQEPDCLVIVGCMAMFGILSVLSQLYFGSKVLSAIRNGRATVGRKMNASQVMKDMLSKRYGAGVNAESYQLLAQLRRTDKVSTEVVYSFVDESGVSRQRKAVFMGMQKAEQAPDVVTVFFEPGTDNACVLESIPGKPRLSLTGSITPPSTRSGWVILSLPLVLAAVFAAFIYWRYVFAAGSL